MPFPRWILLLSVLLCGAPGPAAAQPPVQARPPAATLGAEELDRIGRLLRDDARRAELLRTLEALAAASRAAAGPAPEDAPPPAAAPAAPAPAPAPTPAPAAEEALIVPNTVGAQLLRSLEGRFSTLADALLGAARAMADIPALWSAVGAVLADPITRVRILEASWKLLILFGIALLLEWLTWRSLAGLRRRVLARAPADGTVWHWMRRLPLVLARLGLDLLPVAAFALVAQGLIGAVRPLPTTQLAGLLIANVYIGARIVFVLARALLAPDAARLRLLPFPDQAAAYAVVWLRRMLLVGLGGYVLAEVGVSFGLAWIAYDTIFNLTLLLISLMLVRIILHQRRAVAEALQAPEPEAGAVVDTARRILIRTRNRLAEIWHLIAILWLLAFWAVSALALENGLERLFTASALTLLVVGLARGLDDLLRRVLERAENPTAEVERRWPGLALRAATYGPALRAILTTAIACGGLVLLLEIWGIHATGWFAAGTLGGRLLDTLFSIGATIVLAILVWEAASSAIRRRLARAADGGLPSATSARVRTLLPMLRTVLGAVIAVFVVLSALSQLGVNVAPLLAGAGVVGVAIGFGSQTLVRDVITGVFLLLEDAVAVGDVVSLGGLSGVVEALTIRSIKLRALDGSVHTIPFSAVTTVTNMTRDFSFAVLDVTVGYREDPDRVGEVLKEIGREMRAEPKWQTAMRDDIDVWGVERFGDSGVVIRARAKTEPAARWNVLRELNRRVKIRFGELGIEIPYPHQTLVLEQAEEVRYPPRPRAAE